MYRSAGIRSIMMLLVISLVGTTATLAEDPATSFAGHPLVGAWVVDTNSADPSDPPARLILSTDGSLLQVMQGKAAVGAWEPTGTRTGALTFAADEMTADGAVSTAIVRATLEASADGATWSATYTVEYGGASGGTSGQVGPTTATASRIDIEPMHPTTSPVP